MAIDDYDLLFVSRVPNATGGVDPTLTEIGTVIPKTKLSWTRELWFDGGSVGFSLEPDEVPTAIAERLVDPFAKPSEVRLYKGSTLIQQGPVTSCQVQGGTATVQTRGLMYYTRYMHLTVDKSYTATDQYTIVKELVDHHQAKTYGDFGIDTSGIGSSGVTVNREYKANRAHNVFETIDGLAQRQNGFDYYVSIDTGRDLVLTSARGTDKSADVILDARGIFSPQVSMSAAQRQVGSQAIAIGHSFEEDPVIGDKEDATALAAFGRAQTARHFDTIPTQADIDAIAQELVDSYAMTVFHPGELVMFPVIGTEPITDFDVGDKITWNYDAGLGLQTEARDVKRITVTINEDGEEKMSVEFV